jgi:tetratricopeptide (TPR) repeat protein
MSTEHSRPEDFEAFLRSANPSRSKVRNAHLVRHLLAECSPCRQNLSAVITKRAGGYDYNQAFAGAARSLDAFLATSRNPETSPEDLLAELAPLSAEEQARRVAEESRFAYPAFIKHLIDASHAVRYQDAAQMQQLANQARLAAEACTARMAGSEPKLADLRAQAWRQYGNSLRVLGRLWEAEEALAASLKYLEAGTRDPLLRARFCNQLSSLRMFQSRFDEAIDMAEEAGQIYAELGEIHLLASAEVQKAIACLHAGEAEEAVGILNHAIPLIEGERDPQLLLAACHNLVRCYIDLGRPEQALSIYFETRNLYKRFDDPLIRLKVAWHEGQLLRDMGHLRAAEGILLQTRQGFVERNLLHEAALISLDLSAVYVRLQAEQELQQTIAETVPIFRALGVDREVLASLLQLRQLSHQSRQALELIRFLNARIEQLPPRQTFP